MGKVKRSRVPGIKTADREAVKVGPVVASIIRWRRAMFEVRYGREATPEDPIFFDLTRHGDTPTVMPTFALEELLAARFTGEVPGEDDLGLTAENGRLAAREIAAGCRLDEAMLRAYRRAGRKAWL